MNAHQDRVENTELVVRLDERVKNIEQDVLDIKITLGKQDTKLDELVGYASMAKGAGWIIIKMGGWLTAIAAAAWTIWHYIFPVLPGR